jgi:hypothetical protein
MSSAATRAELTGVSTVWGFTGDWDSAADMMVLAYAKMSQAATATKAVAVMRNSCCAAAKLPR